MDIDATVKSIRNVYIAVSGKIDVDVILTYKGHSHGITKPWHLRVDARELNHETYEGALSGLLKTLKEELSMKVKTTEGEAARLRQALNNLGN